MTGVIRPSKAAFGKRTLYGWASGDRFYVSALPPKVFNRPRNSYASREEAEAEATQRESVIEWES